MKVEGDGASGNWTVPGAELSFEGASDSTTYKLTVDYPLCDIEGTFELDSVSLFLNMKSENFHEEVHTKNRIDWSGPLRLQPLRSEC